MANSRFSIVQYGVRDYEVTYKRCGDYDDTIDRSRGDVHTIKAAQSARQRAHSKLFGILRCQQWSFFVTLTFGDDLDDQTCRDLFQSWRREIKEKFPNMYYVAVPEYQARGVLHYHIVVGGVSLADLRCKYSGRVLHFGQAWREKDFLRRGFAVNLKKGEGAKIYNIGSWVVGHSTLTEVWCLDAVNRYIGKYITKNNVDPRFYNKKRFHCSENIIRPQKCTYDESHGVILDDLGTTLIYQSKRLVFSKYSVDLSKEEMIKLYLNGGELPT